MEKRKRILHPIVFSIYPIIFLFARNIEEVKLQELVLPLSLSIIFTIVIWKSLSKLLRSNEKAALLTSLFLIYFFSFGHFYSLINNMPSNILDIDTKLDINVYDFILPWSMFFLLVGIFIKRTQVNFISFSSYLNYFSLLLLIFPIISILVYCLAHLGNLNVNLTLRSEMKIKKQLPDIYYIIPDSYAGYRTLKKVYGYDNSDFLNYLSKKGFYVAGKSRANYLRTLHSVASSLNLNYISDLCKKVDSNSSSESEIYELIRRSYLVRYLKSQGYKYIFSSGESWGSDLVDKYIYLDDNQINFDFLLILGNSTLLRPLIRNSLSVNYEKHVWMEIISQFKQMDYLIKNRPFKEPMFVFIHLLIPHGPYVFDQNGNFVPGERNQHLVGKEKFPLYVNEVIYVNKRLRSLIDKILTNNKINKPIIIFQSDEGPFKTDEMNLDGEKTDWTKVSEAAILRHVKILNAYYLPGFDQKKLYQSITPVNSFRLIFNHYFGQNLPALPDKSYFIPDIDHQYKYTDITEKVKKK